MRSGIHASFAEAERGEFASDHRSEPSGKARPVKLYIAVNCRREWFISEASPTVSTISAQRFEACPTQHSNRSRNSRGQCGSACPSCPATKSQDASRRTQRRAEEARIGGAEPRHRCAHRIAMEIQGDRWPHRATPGATSLTGAPSAAASSMSSTVAGRRWRALTTSRKAKTEARAAEPHCRRDARRT
jgi:hypothetical protein